MMTGLPRFLGVYPDSVANHLSCNLKTLFAVYLCSLCGGAVMEETEGNAWVLEKITGILGEEECWMTIENLRAIKKEFEK
ncbi:Hypothetical protein TGAM_0185 [Thermococcus gammatolerans EJ3]|uniref:Uncharacterized protein n=1 Tax=Thermococcus gammatolerans (strain DSM 15229 / JCM 11827 / EJ3) TaxID=593117 RepID=C5A375_THEGJ|nr:Hypothetical protein TGAM_0185 [Thermococcus gammatolerans EJ3]